MESDSEDFSTGRTSRKRRRNDDKYKRNIIKRSRLSGESYISHSGKPVEKPKFGTDCRCKRHCYKKVSDEEIIDLFTKFHNLRSKNEQDIFLQQNIEMVPVSRRQKKESSPKKTLRTKTFQYFVTSNIAGKLQVCKSAFQTFFGITGQRIRRLCNILKEGKLPEDRRGKHPCKHAIPGEICQQIEEHIKIFPLKVSHYSSKQVFYLDAQLDVRQMHNLFTEKYPGTDVKYEFYLKIFNERFSLRFGRPQVDTCCSCEELGVRIKSSSLNENARRVAAAELIIHKRRSKKFYHKLREVKDICDPKSNNHKDTVLGIAFDYMMNLQLPKIPVQETFYLRQLTVNAFCVTNLKTNASKFYLYHEGIGGKGPNEVTSFVDDYVNTEVPPEIKHLYIFSDSCGGQNKNHTLLKYFSALVEAKKFERIEQFYPIRGHSFLPCDRAFGCVKRKLNKVDRIYTLRQFTKIIVKSSPKFQVQMVRPDDIFLYKPWWKTYFKKSCLSECSYGRQVPKERKINFLNIKYSHFIHASENIGKVQALEFYRWYASSDIFNENFYKYNRTLKISSSACLQIK